jgi:hypothetical protein
VLECCNKIPASFLRPRSTLQGLELPKVGTQAHCKHPKAFLFFFAKKNKIEAGVSRKKQRVFMT